MEADGKLVYVSLFAYAKGMLLVDNGYRFDNCMNCWYIFDLANLWLHNEGWTRQEPDPGKRFKPMEETNVKGIQGDIR